jgi:hypothetical protein
VVDYDPLNYDTWPEEQQDFLSRVFEGFGDGDLMPLADYLRAGHYIPQFVGEALADAIERKEWGFFHIVPKGRERGQLGRTAFRENHDRKMKIGVYLEDRLRTYGQGSYAAALDETLAKFDIKSSATVAKAHKYLRAHIESANTAEGFDLFEHLKDLYLTP